MCNDVDETHEHQSRVRRSMLASHRGRHGPAVSRMSRVVHARERRTAVAWAVVCGLWVPPVNAQVEGSTDTGVSPQLWADYNPTVPVASTVDLFGDIGLRSELESDAWWRVVVRPGVRACRASGVCLSGGIGSFYTFNEVGPDTWEVRPFQGVSATWPRGRVSLTHYVRLEERFDFNTSTWTSQVSLRGRYQLAASLKWDAVQPDRYWSLTGTVEGFLTLAGDQGQFREQVRATIGLERSFRRSLRIRGEVSWQQRRLFVQGTEVSDVFLRVRIFQGWGGGRAVGY